MNLSGLTEKFFLSKAWWGIKLLYSEFMLNVHGDVLQFSGLWNSPSPHLLQFHVQFSLGTNKLSVHLSRMQKFAFFIFFHVFILVVVCTIIRSTVPKNLIIWVNHPAQLPKNSLIPIAWSFQKFPLSRVYLLVFEIFLGECIYLTSVK